jgi:L-fuconolactonase
MIIDAHQHFWQLSRNDYGWLTPELAPLYRDFMPDDLAPILKAHGVGGTILVQAAPTIEETEFLLDIAQNTSFVKGVVGWVDFESPSATKDIARLASNHMLVGLRPMIQDIADDDWMLRSSLSVVFDAMIKHDLTFDALVLPRHLPRLRQLMARQTGLRVVIDHGAKPDIANGLFDDWAKDMAEIAAETDAFCKFSGLLTEAGADWTEQSIVPFAAHLLDVFGPNRLIWGSDWPVVTCTASYAKWFGLANAFVPNPKLKKAVFGQVACRAYNLA